MNEHRVIIRPGRRLSLGEAIGVILWAARDDLGREPRSVSVDFHDRKDGPVIRHLLIFN